MVFDRIFGRKKQGLSKEGKQYLQRERELYIQTLQIMQRCRTKQEILDGFSEIAGIASRFNNEDLANSARHIAENLKSLPIEYVVQLRNDQIYAAEAFLVTTKKYS